jgi:hypothetical protein
VLHASQARFGVHRVRPTVAAVGAVTKAPESGHSRKGTSLMSDMRHLKQ